MDIKRLRGLQKEKDRHTRNIGKINTQIHVLLNACDSIFRRELERKYADTYWMYRNRDIDSEWNLYFHVKKVSRVYDNGTAGVCCHVMYDSFEVRADKIITVEINKEGYAHVVCSQKKITKSVYEAAKAALLRKLAKI